MKTEKFEPKRKNRMVSGDDESTIWTIQNKNAQKNEQKNHNYLVNTSPTTSAMSWQIKPADMARKDETVNCILL